VHDPSWANWAGNQRAAPVAIEEPTSTSELVAVVRRAAKAGHTVKAVGAGHSFTDIAVANGVQVRLGRYGRFLAHDRTSDQVTVEAGISLRRLNGELAARGLALPNLGDISYQSLAGAISTATHGTGIGLGGLATQVVGLEMVTADGDVVSCSESEEREFFKAAQVGLGALGLLSRLTLQAVPAFNLHAVEEAMRLEQLLEELDGHVGSNEHFEFFWVPHTRWCLTKRNNRTDEPSSARARLSAEWKRIVRENLEFGALCWLGRARPQLIPRLVRLGGSASLRSEFVARSDKVFATPRWVRFCEMEYSIPRAAAVEAMRGLYAFVKESGLYISFPVEVRFSAADDIFLSTANGGERCYIAVHMFRGMPYEQYFRGVEAIMDAAGGRPHWGKLHFQDAASLAPRYADWDRFQGVRRRLDPGGRFANAYTERVLGPAGG
jgi:L-gulono-1,4-lactone dehydrogenase